MTAKSKQRTFFVFLIIFSGFFAYNLLRGSIEYVDAIFSITFMLLSLLLSEWLRIDAKKLGFIGAILVLHNIGATWLYNQMIFFIRYDKIVHFIASLVGTVMVMGVLKETIHINKLQKKLILALLSVSMILALGVLVEFFEFSGYLIGINSQGILSPGNLAVGDVNYRDTITDLIANIAGGIVGVVFVYVFKNRFFHHK